MWLSNKSQRTPLDSHVIRCNTEGMDDWTAALKDENILLNTELVFYLQNGGVSMVLCDGEQIMVSKKTRRLFAELVSTYRNAKYMGNDFLDALYSSPLKIRFHNGIPSASRKQRIEFQRECDWLDNEMIQRDYQAVS